MGIGIVPKPKMKTLAELFKTLFLETSPGPVKYALELVGQMTGTLRLPLVMPEPGNPPKN